MILEELSKHNDKWKQTAFNICKDYDLAQDLVQLMYLKLKDREKFNDSFVTTALYYLWKDHLKKRKEDRIDEIDYLVDNTNTFEPDDEQQGLLDEFENIDWVAQELLLERSEGRSLRDIQKMYNINYGYVYRETTKAIKQITMKKDEDYYKGLDKRSKEYKAYAKFNKIGNELVKSRQPLRDLTNEQYISYKEYKNNRTLNIWKDKEIQLLIDTYSHVFAIQYILKDLKENSKGSDRKLRRMSKELDIVFNTYKN